MSEAYIIYTFLLLFMISSTWMYRLSSRRYQKYIMAIIVIVYSLILGLRYNVGVDYLAYKEIFMHQDFSDVEVGYALVNKFLYVLGFSYPAIFILVAFGQIYFFLKGVEAFDKKILPFVVFFYFTTLYLFLSLNVLRQTLAFSIFVFSLRYIQHKNLFKYLITILFAFIFHRSAIILFPLYFIANIDYLLRHRRLQLVLYFSTFLFSVFFSDFLWNNFATLAQLLGYSDYADSVSVAAEIEWGGGGGLGLYMWMIIDLWVILCYNKYRYARNSQYDIVVYNLYFIGLLLANVVAGSYFDRVNIYFQHIRIIVYAIFFYRLFILNNKAVEKIMAFAIFIVLLIFFYMGINNRASLCAPFNFVFTNYVY